MTEENEAAEAASPPGSKKKLFIILGVLVALLAAVGAATWFAMGRSSEATEHAEETPAKPPVYLALETFTVNLHDSEQFLQVDLTLQATEPAEVDTIKLHMPRVRSRLLTLLASKDAEELLAPEGKDKLAKDILAEINKPFEPKGSPQKIVDVLFTSFVIQ